MNTLFEKASVVEFNTGLTLAAKRPTETYLTRLINNIGKRVEVDEVGFVARCILLVFSVLDKRSPTTYLGEEMHVLIANLSGVPVLVAAGKRSSESNALGTSLFWAIYHAVEAKNRRAKTENDESLILSVVGLHYTLCLAENELKVDSVQRRWVKDTRYALFYTNAGLREAMQKTYEKMVGTDIVRGNSVFALLGVFVDTCASDNLDETITKYNVLIKNAYVPFIKI